MLTWDGQSWNWLFRGSKRTYGLLLAFASLLKLSGLKTEGLGGYSGSLWIPGELMNIVSPFFILMFVPGIVYSVLVTHRWRAIGCVHAEQARERNRNVSKDNSFFRSQMCNIFNEPINLDTGPSQFIFVHLFHFYYTFGSTAESGKSSFRRL